MDWRVIVVDETRFCVVGTFDLTFDECNTLSDPRRGVLDLPERSLATIGSWEVAAEPAFSVATIRGSQFHKVDSKGQKRSMLFVMVNSDGELDRLRRTGRFREWDADLREAVNK